MQSLTFLRRACTGAPAPSAICNPSRSCRSSSASSKHCSLRRRFAKLASPLTDRHCKPFGSFDTAQIAHRAHFHALGLPAASALVLSAMADDDYDKFAKVAIQAAQAAGQQIKQAFNEDKDVHFKGKLDLVTATDQQCEQTISATISEAFPDHKFIGEEGSSAQGFTNELTDDPTWMVDPLDGTTNFVHRFPFVCTSIALVIQKQIVVGVVFNPVLGELFTAVKGKGAFLNGQSIRVSSKDQLDQALLATEIGVSRDEGVMDAIFDRIRKVTMKMRSVRCSGACALNLCSVACGRIDVMYEVGFGGCWDCAAGALIVTEAGGQMLDPSGSPFNVMSRRVLGANANLGKPVADIIASCRTSNKEPAPFKK